MEQAKNQPQEIRLFGEKSLREEAYRQKILQLEKELADLEAIAKESNLNNDEDRVSSTGRLKGLYYESLLSFDKRVKKEQEFLEKRATELTERLDLQTQRMILNIEASFKRKVKWIIFLILLIIPFLILSFFGAYYLITTFSPTASHRTYQPSNANLSEKKIPYLKNILQAQTRYRHQYNVLDLRITDGTYIADIELNFYPENKWYLKSVCEEIMEAFQRYASGAPAEFSFFHQGKLYIKALLTDYPQRLHFQYFF
jgi:hypothetical protein